MNPKNYLIALLLVAGTASVAMAQDNNTVSHDVSIDIPEIALLDLETDQNLQILLAAEAPQEAGLPLDLTNNSNEDIWVNYTSIIGSQTEPSREVTVQITSGTVPNGLQLAVEAANFQGSGKGNHGSPAGKIYLNGNAQSLISTVGSAYTGDGTNNGHKLTYSLEMNDLDKFGDLDFDQANQAMSITYTLTDN